MLFHSRTFLSAILIIPVLFFLSTQQSLASTYRVGFPAPDHWNESERPNWTNYPWPKIKGQLMRRMKIFAGWLGCMEYVSDQKIIDLATDCITQEGLMDEAKCLHREIMKCIHQKPSTVTLFVKALKIARQDFRLVTLDVRNRRRIVKKIPIC